MAQDAVIDPNTGLPVNFDYGVEAQKLQRQRDIANQLLTYQQPNGQIFSNDAGTFYGGGTGGMGALAKMLMAYMGKNTNDGADTAQAKLNADSVAALKRDLNNAPQPTVSMVPGGPDVPMGPPTPPDSNATAVANALTGNTPPPSITGDQIPMGPGAGYKPLVGATPPTNSPTSLIPAAGAVPQTPTFMPTLNQIPEPPGSMGKTNLQPQTTPPPQGDQMAWLQKLSQDGPFGAQIANSIIANKFAKPDYKTVVDPVTGKIVAYNEHDIHDGAVLSDPGKGIPQKQIDTPTGVVNVYKDGTTAPLIGADGKQVVSTTTTADNRAAIAAQNDNAAKLSSLKNADESITNQLQKINQLKDLYDNTTMVGPILGHGMALTANQQKLEALTAALSFGETTNALQGTVDSGAAPKLNMVEIKTMLQNGLSRTTSPEAAKQLLQNIQDKLMATQKNLKAQQQQFMTPDSSSSGLSPRQPNSGPGGKVDLNSFGH